MKTKLGLSVLSLLVSVSAYAQDDSGLFLAETRVQHQSSCNAPDPDQAALDLDIESAAFQRCQNPLQQMELTKAGDLFNKVQVCTEGEGGVSIYQRLYLCEVRVNPDALSDNMKSMLQSVTDSRHYSLLYFGSPCLRFRVTGMSSLEPHPEMALRDLVSSLEVSEDGIAIEASIVDAAQDLYAQYSVYGGIRSRRLSVRNLQAGQSINELISKKLGRSAQTGFIYGVQVVPSECQQ